MKSKLFNLIVFLVMIISFVSCSNMKAINRVVKDNMPMRGGVNGEKSWEDSLVFKRTSWYKRANMTSDIFLAKLEKDSPFVSWLGSAKSRFENECSQFYVAIMYNRDLGSTSKAMLKSPITSAGFKEVSIPEFKSNVRAHPIFNGLNLESHAVTGFCAGSQLSEVTEIYLALPGFNKTNLL